MTRPITPQSTPKADEAPTAINGWIRKSPICFYRFGDVGYTATHLPTSYSTWQRWPILDFIINLPAPSNYIGAEKIFGTSLEVNDTNNDLLPIVRKINDLSKLFPDSHKKEWWTTNITTYIITNSYKVFYCNLRHSHCTRTSRQTQFNAHSCFPLFKL